MPSNTNPTNPPNPLLKSHLRIARPTSSITPLIPFYTTGLGFQILGSFTNHSGFSGIMLGHPELPYHLEFTVEEGDESEGVGRAPSKDNLLVFYVPDEAEWRRVVDRMEGAGFESVTSWNPYWEGDGRGRTFEDADGWRVVIWNGGWGV